MQTPNVHGQYRVTLAPTFYDDCRSLEVLPEPNPEQNFVNHEGLCVSLNLSVADITELFERAALVQDTFRHDEDGYLAKLARAAGHTLAFLERDLTETDLLFDLDPLSPYNAVGANSR